MGRWFSENWLALAALVVAVAALGVTIIPIRQAQAAHRATNEVHDVTWDWEWIEPGVVELRNESATCIASGVSVRMEVVGELVRGNAATVGPGEHLTLRFARAASEYVKELRKLRTVELPRHSPSGLGILPFPPQWQLDMDRASEIHEARMAMLRHHVEWRVDWTTPLGTPKVVEDRAMSSLGPSPGLNPGPSTP